MAGTKRVCASGRRRVVSALMIAAAIGGLVTRAAGQDVEFVGIHVIQEFQDGQQTANPFTFEAEAAGPGLQSVTPVQVMTPNGGTLVLTFDPGDDEWRHLQPGIASLCDVESQYGFGDYTFLFPWGDQTTVSFDPGTADCATLPFTGYGDVVSPQHLATGVDLFPTIEWTCVGGPCGTFGWFVEVYPMNGIGTDFSGEFLNPAATSWTPPGCLTGGRTYGLYLATATALPGGIQNLVTTMGDAFVYAPAWEHTNTIEFDTRAPVGTSYCVTAPNSAGPGARICVAGSPTVADQDLTIVAHDCPEDVPGLFYFGPDQLAGGPPFGNGHRCVRVGGSRRVYPFATTGPSNGSPAGTAVRELDFSAPYATGLMAGSNANFQYWYRDNAAGGAGFNLTDGVQVMLQ